MKKKISQLKLIFKKRSPLPSLKMKRRYAPRCAIRSLRPSFSHTPNFSIQHRLLPLNKAYLTSSFDKQSWTYTLPDHIIGSYVRMLGGIFMQRGDFFKMLSLFKYLRGLSDVVSAAQASYKIGGLSFTTGLETKAHSMFTPNVSFYLANRRGGVQPVISKPVKRRKVSIKNKIKIKKLIKIKGRVLEIKGRVLKIKGRVLKIKSRVLKIKGRVLKIKKLQVKRLAILRGKRSKVLPTKVYAKSPHKKIIVLKPFKRAKKPDVKTPISKPAIVTPRQKPRGGAKRFLMRKVRGVAKKLLKKSSPTYLSRSKFRLGSVFARGSSSLLNVTKLSPHAIKMPNQDNLAIWNLLYRQPLLNYSLKYCRLSRRVRKILKNKYRYSKYYFIIPPYKRRLFTMHLWKYVLKFHDERTFFLKVRAFLQNFTNPDQEALLWVLFYTQQRLALKKLLGR